MKERRKHVRVTINQHVWVCDFDESTSPASLKDCLIIDISEGGACIECSDRYEKGQLLTFTFQDFLGQGPRPVSGTVMWSSQRSETCCRYGIQFLGLSTQMLRAIRDQVLLAAKES